MYIYIYLLTLFNTVNMNHILNDFYLSVAKMGKTVCEKLE